MIYGDPIILGGGGSGGPTAQDAILLATVQAGSTATATKNGVTVTPTLWVSAADSSLETALFVFTPAQFDNVNPWTITATDGTHTASETVLITSNKEYEVVISYRVPAEYQAVEYLQSSGTQYINCNYIPVETERYVCDGKFDDYSGWMFGTNGGNGWSFMAGDGRFQWRAVGIRYDRAYNLDRNTFVCSKEELTVNGESYTGTERAGFVIGNNNFWLFGPGPGYGGTKLTGKIYDFQTYIGDNLIHHYCPCYRKSDSVAGMWDNVDKVFYTNAGTGTFVVGPDL